MKKTFCNFVQLDLHDFHLPKLTAFVDSVISTYADTYKMTETDVMTEDFGYLVAEAFMEAINSDNVMDMLTDEAYTCVSDNHYQISYLTQIGEIKFGTLIWERQKAYECK